MYDANGDGNRLKVLIACEYSGRVRDAFAQLGHDAWSCDILPTETKGNHYEGSVLDILDNGWHLMIATHLAPIYLMLVLGFYIQKVF